MYGTSAATSGTLGVGGGLAAVSFVEYQTFMVATIFILLLVSFFLVSHLTRRLRPSHAQHRK